MSKAKVTVDEWVDMFRSIGLDDDRMLEWHKEFECRHPDAHESFLQWLDLPSEHIGDIRARAADRA
jgi:hypothetical protein